MDGTHKRTPKTSTQQNTALNGTFVITEDPEQIMNTRLYWVRVVKQTKRGNEPTYFAIVADPNRYKIGMEVELVCVDTPKSNGDYTFGEDVVTIRLSQ